MRRDGWSDGANDGGRDESLYGDISLHTAHEDADGRIAAAMPSWLPRDLLAGKGGIIHRLALMGVHDLETMLHLFSTSDLTRRITTELRIDNETSMLAIMAAMVHDLGKLDVPHEVLAARRPLTEHEWTIMRLHPAASARMMHEEGESRLATVVLSHHERLDGSGYPDGLYGHAIPLATQFVSVADAYDTMRFERGYKAARTHDDVMEELDALGGVHFDREIIAALGRIPPATMRSSLVRESFADLRKAQL